MDDGSLAIEVAHAHKGKQKPASQHASYRPLGLAHPLCCLRSDVLRLRMGGGLACAAGVMQLGGLRDARAVVAARQEAAALRRDMELPSVEINVDARFGYDGGRHARFMENATLAEADSRDWLLCHRLLTGHRIRIRDCTDAGCIATLPDVSPGGGGSVQGLSLSGPLYNPLPVACEAWVLAAVPRACTFLPAVLLRAYHMTRDSLPDGLWSGSVQSSCAAAWAMEKLLSASTGTRVPAWLIFFS